MSNTNPIRITPAEWEEIIRVPEVREGWGIQDDETSEDFARMVYGVKFNFVSGGPGYFGDLYILQGDALTGDPPLVLCRYDGTLRPAYD